MPLFDTGSRLVFACLLLLLSAAPAWAQDATPQDPQDVTTPDVPQDTATQDAAVPSRTSPPCEAASQGAVRSAVEGTTPSSQPASSTHPPLPVLATSNLATYAPDTSQDVGDPAVDALVWVFSSWFVGMGVLIEDQQTVLIPGNEFGEGWQDLGRDFMVMGGDPQVEVGSSSVEVLRFSDSASPFLLIHLEAPLPLEPLTVFRGELELGDPIRVLANRADGEVESMQSMVGGISTARIGAATQLHAGALILSEDGELVALQRDGATGVRIAPLLDELEREERPTGLA
ncbi:MAG: hypothetical protein RBU37_23065, partial [Myxococcota bacterium]|nr:hypothetical protein [Myxococcota bacterium]